MQLKEVMSILDTIAPFDSAEEWDNVGLMVGDPESDIRSILVALDSSLEVIKAAENSRSDLIITHHPLMVQPIKRINFQDGVAKKIAMLIQSKINLVSMHTNLDMAPGGVADELAEVLMLKDIKVVGSLRFGSIGAPLPLQTWLKTIPFKNARIIDAGREVYRVGACPGSGMEFWRIALQEGCDTLVTGDVRYHAALDALEAGLNVIDVGHFCSEQAIIQPLADNLRKKLNRVDVTAFLARDIFSFYHE